MGRGAPSPEELDRILSEGKVEACLELFRGTAEVERRPLAPVALEWFRKASRSDLEVVGNKGPETTMRVRWALGERVLEACELAVLATASAGELSRLRFVPRDGENALALLSALRPSSLDAWAGALLEWGSGNWGFVRRLVRAGLCRKPAGDGYTLGLIGHAVRAGKSFASLRDFLLSDPELIDVDLWRLFEVEGSGEDSLAARDKYARPPFTWAETLVGLAREGRLPRDRLLDASLGALARDFAQFRAGWFSRFHEALEPALPEREERLDRYLRLLASSIPPTATFALKAVRLVDAARPIAASRLAAHLEPVLTARSKAAIKYALELLERAARREKAFAPAGARLAAGALLHASPEVQALALAFLERHGDPENAELRRRIGEVKDNAAASLRARLSRWVGPPASAGGGAAGAIQPPAASSPPRAAASDIGARAWPAPLAPPISSLDELLDRAAFVLENPGETDELERVLDGVSRLCGLRPGDLAERSGPLRKRCRGALDHPGTMDYARDIALTRRLLAVCLSSWLEGSPASLDRLEKELARYVPACMFLLERSRALAGRAARGLELPLLSAPTGRGGWIDPRVLPARLEAWRKAGAAPDIHDQALALLRIDPEHRAEALRGAAGLHGELAAALRFALGADGVEIGPTAALWIAGARARSPREDSPALERAHPRSGPDAARAARVSWKAVVKREKTLSGEAYSYEELLAETDPPLPVKVETARLPVLFHFRAGWRFDSRSYLPEEAAIRWLGLLCPGLRESFVGLCLARLFRTLAYAQAEDADLRAFLMPLAGAGEPLGPQACRAIALGLASRSVACALAARDALIAALEDGRVPVEPLGAALAEVFPLECLAAGRWAKSLAEVARASPRHARSVSALIQRSLRGDPARTRRDLHHLLELLVELLSETGSALDDRAAREYLEGVRSGGRTAKLVRRLLDA
jgi:hypothetical protein